MEDRKTCPNCDSELPTGHLDGLCPRCLLEEGVGETIESPGRRFLAPPPYQIAPEFPDLKILGLLGQGGMGAVYRVRHAKLGRDLALKIVPKDAVADATFPERFLREAKALSSLSHPGIVMVSDFGQAGDHLYLLMEFVDGPSLRILLGGGRLDPARAVEMAVHLTDALAYAHDRGVVHRDVKPENVLIDEGGHVSIVVMGEMGAGWKPVPAAFSGTAAAGLVLTGLQGLHVLATSPTLQGTRGEFSEQLSGPWPGLGTLLAFAAYGFALFQALPLHTGSRGSKAATIRSIQRSRRRRSNVAGDSPVRKRDEAARTRGP